MKMQFKINRALLPMKAHYFLFNAGTGPVTPYLSIYAKQLGFSSFIVGLIYMILPICGMFAKPLFGIIADRFHCQKLIFLIAQLLTAAAFLSILYSPKIQLNNEVNFTCNGPNVALTKFDSSLEDLINIQNFSTTSCELSCPMNREDFNVLCHDFKWSEYCFSDSETLIVDFTALVDLKESQYYLENKTGQFTVLEIERNSTSFIPICSQNPIQTTCKLKCNASNVNAIFKNSMMIEDDIAYQTHQFWIFLFLMIFGWIGQAVTVSIGDAICFEMLENKPHRYGYQRMYGALGWGILTLVSGVLVDVLSQGKAQTDYSICFYLGAVFLILDFLNSSQLKYTQSKRSTSILKDIGKLLVNIRILIFLFYCICVGICTGLMWNFFLWLVGDLSAARNEKHTQTLQGILMGVQCLGGELPFFFLSGKILKKLGHVFSMALALFTLGIRFILYSVIPNPWYFIPIECSNGLTYGLFYACMASYASIVAPAGTEATMQGLVGAVFEGVGVSLGSFLAGISFRELKAELTFRYFGIAVLISAVFYVVIQRILGDSSSGLQRKMNIRRKVPLDNNKFVTELNNLIIDDSPIIKR